jgi:hypothetical protein
MNQINSIIYYCVCWPKRDVELLWRKRGQIWTKLIQIEIAYSRKRKAPCQVIFGFNYYDSVKRYWTSNCMFYDTDKNKIHYKLVLSINQTYDFYSEVIVYYLPILSGTQ